MDAEVLKKKRRQLEENYNQEKKELLRQQSQMEVDLRNFKRETDSLIDKVNFFTKNDHWNKQSFYREMEQSELIIKNEAKKLSQELADEQQELKKTYQRTLEELEKNDQ